MDEITKLLTDTEKKLIKSVEKREIKEAKDLIKLWEHIIEVQAESEIA